MQSILYIGLYVQGITMGRLTSIVIAVVAIISVIIGRQAMVRINGRIGSGRPKAIAALAMGVIGILASMLHLVISSGDFGSGSGKAGAIVGLALGIIGAALGWLALVRSQQVAGGQQK